MKFAICILVHHKQWLIQSSLISLLLQRTNLKYDIHFIIIKGDGKNLSYSSYKNYFKYSKLFNQKNSQLSDFDPKTLDIIKKLKKNYKFHYVDNDQGLDSSAWVKFIKKKIFLKYDYSFFLMEGFIFTSENVLESINKFIKQKKPNFVTSGHEKRIILKQYFFENFLTKKKKIKSIEDFEKYNSFKIISQFLTDKKFKKIIYNWPKSLDEKIKGRTENHSTKYKISLMNKIKLLIKSFLFRGNLINFKKYKFIVTENKSYFLNFEKKRKVFSFKDILYHLEDSPYFYGCSCQHLMSKNYLSKLDKYLTKNKINTLIKLPFFATPFEILWGIFPSVLGYKKWFFNGIHRPRKHFLNLDRDDDVKGVASYLNLYFGKIANFKILKNKIKVDINDIENIKLIRLIKNLS